MYYEHHVLNINDADTLSVLFMRVAIQVVYCHYMLTPSVECLWYVKF